MSQRKYEHRGVSADKKEVHDAIKTLDKGLYPNAFCKILPDYISNDPNFVNVMHADTAGTKTSLAYLYWKETNDIEVWKGIIQDAMVMNLDDMACVGITDNIVLSSTIGRNKSLIPGEVISKLINSTQSIIGSFHDLGINIQLAGGETADVGDIVRTIDVGFTTFARIEKDKLLLINPKPGDVVVGLASFGQATYESDFNSGIGSNGLTFARHEVLCDDYAKKYPESFNPLIEKKYVYSGRMHLTDQSYISGKNIGQLLLSPTRTYIPVIAEIIKQYKNQLHGIIHCTGGGQTKVLHFINDLHIVKDNLFEIPDIFKHIQEQANSSLEEMFQVFNMGHRLEVYTDEKTANEIISISKSFNIASQIIGHVESSEQKSLTIKYKNEIFHY